MNSSLGPARAHTLLWWLSGGVEDWTRTLCGAQLVRGMRATEPAYTGQDIMPTCAAENAIQGQSQDLVPTDGGKEEGRKETHKEGGRQSMIRR